MAGSKIATQDSGATKEADEAAEASGPEKWSPELLAATVTIIVTLAAGQSSYPFLPSSSEVNIAAAITVAAAAILGRWIYRMGKLYQFLTTLSVTLIIVFGFS